MENSDDKKISGAPDHVVESEHEAEEHDLEEDEEVVEYGEYDEGE